jgi:AcrR family transcriptional regulator
VRQRYSSGPNACYEGSVAAVQYPHEGHAPFDVIESRILEATIELAVAGGYEAVRQRDVAAKAKVALATVYARFASKDILLAAALELDSRRWLPELAKVQLRGRTPLVRVTKLFEHLTASWVQRPQLARASLRAATSGDHQAMLRQMVAQQRIHAVIVDALRGPRHAPAMRREPALRVATVLTMVWFANLTAWAAGIIDEAIVVDIVRQSADMLLHGVQPQ